MVRRTARQLVRMVEHGDRVYLDHKGPNERGMDTLGVRECERCLHEGEFPSGSMGPKIESAVMFLKSGGERAIIASLEKAEDGLAGKSGTTITR